MLTTAELRLREVKELARDHTALVGAKPGFETQPQRPCFFFIFQFLSVSFIQATDTY